MIEISHLSRDCDKARLVCPKPASSDVRRPRRLSFALISRISASPQQAVNTYRFSLPLCLGPQQVAPRMQYSGRIWVPCTMFARTSSYGPRIRLLDSCIRRSGPHTHAMVLAFWAPLQLSTWSRGMRFWFVLCTSRRSGATHSSPVDGHSRQQKAPVRWKFKGTQRSRLAWRLWGTQVGTRI